MKNRVLIIGSEGFSGKSLSRLFINSKNDVYYFDKKKKKLNKTNYFQIDLLNSKKLNSLIKSIKPNKIFNLSGTYTNNLVVDLENNFVTTLNLLNSIVNNKINCRLLLIGSSAEYGNVKKNRGIKETDGLNPYTNYGFVKKLQSQLMHYYVVNHKQDIVMARPFSFNNEHVSKNLFTGNLYDQIKKFKKKQINKIKLGNLDAYRDFIDINLATKHYINIMNFGKSGEVYNVASGKPTHLRKLCLKIFKEMNIDKKYLYEENKIYSFSADIKKIYADISKLNRIHK